MKSEDERPTSVYILWNSDREVIYVGITSARIGRLNQHSFDKDWWQEVAHATFKHYGTRSEAKAIERRLIRQLDPRYNQHLSPSTKAYQNELRALDRKLKVLDNKLEGVPDAIRFSAFAAQRKAHDA